MGQGGAISYESTRPSWPVKMEVFGPSNNFGGEQWVSSYGGKVWWRRVWDHRVRVQDEGLSKIQNQMVKQAEVWAGIVTLLLVIVFVAIPKVGVM